MSALAELTVQLELQSAAFQRGIDQANRSMQRLEQAGKGVDNSLKGLGATLTNVARNAVAAAAAFGSFESIKSVITTADQMKNLEASLNALTGSSESAATSIALIKQTAQEVGLPIATVAEATQKLTVGLTDLGGKEGDVDKIVRAFAMLGRVGGTSLEDVKGALLQYSQAISSGKLGGDELKSIMERMPLVGKMIAEAFGVPIGKLKEMGAEGELTGDKVAKAMIDAAAKIEGKFNILPATFEQSVARMQNKASDFAVALDKALNLSSTGSSVLESIGTGIQNATRFVSDFSAAWQAAAPETKIAATAVAVGALAAVFTGPLVAAIAAVGAAMLANPLLATVGAISAAVLLLAANWEKVKIEVETGVPAALAVMESAFYKVMSAITSAAAKAAESVSGVFIAAVNSVIDSLNALGEKIPSILGGGFKLDKLSADVKFFGDTIAGFDQKIADSDARSSDALKKRAEAYEKLKVAQDKVVGASGTIKAVAGGDEDGSAAEKFADQLQKLIDKLDPASKSAREVKEAIDMLNKAMADGMITPERYAELLKKVGDAFGQDNGIKGQLDAILDQMNSFTKQFVDGIVDAMFAGKLNLEKLLEDMSKSIIKWLLNQQIQKFFKALGGMDLLGGLFGGGSNIGVGTSGFYAKGGAFSKGVEFFASGGVVGSPTMFGMSGGRIGVMGEAGPEAIVPLKRASNGDLGVRSSPVVINVINQAGVQVETSETEKPNGMKEITMMIRREVSTGIADGSFDKQFRTTYGLTRQGF